MSTETLDLPLVPLRDIVVFPGMVIPLFVGREKSVGALEKSMSEQKNVFLASQKNANINDPGLKDIHQTGTIANILQILKLTDGTMKVLVEGLQRAELVNLVEHPDYYEANIVKVDESIKVTQDIKGLMRSISALFEEYIKLNQKIPLEAVSATANITEPDRFADSIAAYLTFQTPEKQDLLDTHDPAERMDKLLGALKSEMEILKIEKRVHGRVRKQVERGQKEFYLNEQIKAIQKELGKQDEFKTDIDELAQKIKKAKMPKDILAKAQKELRRLESMQPISAEATVVRNYIEWLIDLPWKIEKGEGEINIKEAQKILDCDHYGLEKVKERIIEHLAVMKLVKKIKGPIICLVGPPGVGKTSLGKSIARATKRNFVRVSLGGVRDEAEIRGHRRTYIGALPGKIIQHMKKAGTTNPVFMLDEIDKMNSDFRGDPSSAMLEVLDPEQNSNFNDHFLEVDYDLSHVLFVATANTLDNIPGPLLDRMEVIRLPGYTVEEKIAIAEKFLIPNKVEEHGLKKKSVNIGRDTLQAIIREYTREAGVRNLEREIAKLCRKVAKKVVDSSRQTTHKITPANLSKYLGTPPFGKDKEKAKEDQVGIASGLAWTEVGGELLSIEVITTPGKGNLQLTGKLGDVMKESAQAAMSYVRKRYKFLGLEPDFYQQIDLHIHVPEGATPKDGPSAGITMSVAIISALTGNPVRQDITMTGEVTLSGKVLPIGGLKEKSLAAQRVKIPNVIIPKENEKDIADIPETVKKHLKFIPVRTMDEVIKHSFHKKFIPLKKKSTKKIPPQKKSSASQPTIAHIN
jgi:ATP-dependent Lon protease